jgi:1-acyl-sn-glycerol-3-phosphate acyltransferase
MTSDEPRPAPDAAAAMPPDPVQPQPPLWVRRVLSTLIWGATAILALAWVPVMGIVYLFTVRRDPGRYAVGRLFRLAAVVCVKLNPLWRFRTSGVRIHDPRRPYVAVANHQSFADIFLASHLPWEMKWLSKETIFRIPLMGWMMRMAGDVEVRRGERRSRVQALRDCRTRLERQVSVMIMPEGTRSETPDLLPFQDGAFRLAIELGCPVLPLAIAGTAGAMPKRSFLFNRAVAEIRVLEPVETAGLTARDIPELRDRVRERIAATVATLRRELAPS